MANFNFEVELFQRVFLPARPNFELQRVTAVWRCERVPGDSESRLKSLKCFNLERIIDANLAGKEEPDEIDIQDYMGIELEWF